MAADSGVGDAQVDAPAEPEPAEPELLVDGLESPSGLAIDSTFVYWLHRRRVGRAPLDGGEAEVLVETNGPDTLTSDASVAAIHRAGDLVIWADHNDSDGSVELLELGSGTRRTVFDAGPAASPFAVTAVDDQVYWTQPVGVNGGLLGLALDAQDPAPAVLIPRIAAFTIAADARTVVTATSSGDVYLYDLAEGVARHPVEGSAVRGGAFSARDVTIAGSDVFVAYRRSGGDDGLVARLRLDGGDFEILVEAPEWPASLVADDAHIYWTSPTMGQNRGGLWRSRRDGGAPVRLFDQGALGIAQDATHVYWSAPTTGQIWRLSKR